MTTSIVRPAVEIHPQLTDPLLPELLHPSRLLWTPRELAELTATVTTELTAGLRGILRFDEDQRWWARLALTDGVELWLLSWLPGQQTKPHDHGGASGSFTVLQGEVGEEYRYPGGPVRRRTHTAGEGLGFGAGRAHQVTGIGETPAATVHAYSPPLVPTREYATLADVPAEIPPLPAIVGR
ncbi:cysteine dioxygenase family protein [Amycolatopsis sp., V23-08]|uniref:Cysteine dioxygenase family protein n=1 Tax=Amycolatopsis heterodermiae TaxID=3110235 RepID=A0ABU5RPQ3_9PSEU|nr:cysteine dioxygenase family protein [Amycolatopsis sp., V23-08]MEA5367446.1 cysteine dioxygenase family protein [Amycolatopsis sp., V23-08]